MNKTETKREWVVVVGTSGDGNVYLGSLTPDLDVSNGPAVREDDRCGVYRQTNALRFTERGAKRIAKGYANGVALKAE